MEITYTHYRGYAIGDTHDGGMPKGGIFVALNEYSMEYLVLDGTVKDGCIDGWYDNIDHAKQVINTVTSAIKLGGE